MRAVDQLDLAEPETMSSGDTEVTQDVVFDILSSARRRYVLHILNTEGPMELTELAEHVAAQENDTTVAELTKQQRKRVYVSLYQTHVPKLEDAGFVDYDQDSSIVELRSQADEIGRYLGTETRQFPWQYLYLLLAGAGLALVLLANTALPVFGGLSQTDVAVFLLAALAVTAAVHAYYWLSDRSDVLTELRREQ